MPNKLKFSLVNINKETFADELNKKGIYYANVVMWTILFSLGYLISCFSEINGLT